jgi:hypothetical protein
MRWKTLSLGAAALLIAGFMAFQVRPKPGPQPAPALGTEAYLSHVREHLAFRSRVAGTPLAEWDGAEVIAAGQLSSAELQGIGHVQILELGQRRCLWLSRFDVDFAPGLVEVLLSPAPRPKAFADLGRSLPLGLLAAASGDQVLPLPEGVPLDGFRSVALAAPAQQVLIVAAELAFRR